MPIAMTGNLLRATESVHAALFGDAAERRTAALPAGLFALDLLLIVGRQRGWIKRR